MQELCRLLGSRLFEERCGEDASLEMRNEKSRTDNKVRKLAKRVMLLFKFQGWLAVSYVLFDSAYR